jgi:hypothetical protein
VIDLLQRTTPLGVAQKRQRNVEKRGRMEIKSEKATKRILFHFPRLILGIRNHLR